MRHATLRAPALPVPDDDYARRFGGVARLYGQDALARFAAAHICVIGLGGVGSWAAEALARCGVGAMTLIDLDHIALSNTNRQIHALGDAYGRAKIDAMAERIAGINPRAQVRCVDDFVTAENAEALLDHPFDCVIDAIDAVKVKTAIAAYCKRTARRLVMCGAAGGQLDPTRVAVADLSRTIQDPLLAKVRGNLRRWHGFPRGAARRFGIDAVYSDEPLRDPRPVPRADESGRAPRAEPAGLHGLACAGFGSSVCVTAVFGMTAASTALRAIAML